MKTRFIRINDISEIDLSTISVYDLNNRYIDGGGNMYGLRFNPQIKKIEILKIIRTPAKAASYYQQRLVAQKRSRAGEGEAGSGADGLRAGTENGEIVEVVELEFDPGQFVNGVLEVMKTHKDRLNGIMLNIKNSKVIAETERMDVSTLNNLFRNLDVDGIRRIEKVLDNQKELASYPRSISYYQSKLDNEGRRIFESLPEDDRRMKFIYYSEMYTSIRNLYNSLFKVIKDLEFFLSDRNVDAMKNLTHAEKQNFHDATLSIANTLKEISGIMKDLKKLGEYVKDADNFR